MALLVVAVVALAALATVVAMVRSRSMHLWLGAYLKQVRRAPPILGGVRHVFVCVCDHYEPAWGRADPERQRQRVEAWMDRYPRMASSHRDFLGRPPQHTFFFPQEEYEREHLDRLSRLCRDGYGDVEVHLHHDGDTAEGLREKLGTFVTVLHDRHGLLRRDASGRIVFGFIHGNWALDNSARDGRWCGVNDELRVLREAGCYADFTFPSAPSETQPSTINAIYYATDDPLRPKSYDTGTPVMAGGSASGDLLMIQGPLTLDWGSRKWGVLPRIVNGDLSGDNPPSPRRAEMWLKQHVHVRGRPEWVFVKLHTHGAQEKNMDALLGAPMGRTLRHLEATLNDGVKSRLYYVTAWQMYQLVKAAEAGKIDDPAKVLA